MAIVVINLSWSYSRQDVIKPHLSQANIGSGNGLLPSGNLNQYWLRSMSSYGIIRPHVASSGRNKLTNITNRTDAIHANIYDILWEFSLDGNMIDIMLF